MVSSESLTVTESLTVDLLTVESLTVESLTQSCFLLALNRLQLNHSRLNRLLVSSPGPSLRVGLEGAQGQGQLLTIESNTVESITVSIKSLTVVLESLTVVFKSLTSVALNHFKLNHLLSNRLKLNHLQLNRIRCYTRRLCNLCLSQPPYNSAVNISIGRKSYVNYTSYALVNFIIGGHMWHAQLVYATYSSAKFRRAI